MTTSNEGKTPMSAREYLLGGALEDANQCEPHWLEKLSDLMDAYARYYAAAMSAQEKRDE